MTSIDKIYKIDILHNGYFSDMYLIDEGFIVLKVTSIDDNEDLEFTHEAFKVNPYKVDHTTQLIVVNIQVQGNLQ